MARSASPRTGPRMLLAKAFRTLAVADVVTVGRFHSRRCLYHRRRVDRIDARWKTCHSRWGRHCGSTDGRRGEGSWMAVGCCPRSVGHSANYPMLWTKIGGLECGGYLLSRV